MKENGTGIFSIGSEFGYTSLYSGAFAYQS